MFVYKFCYLKLSPKNLREGIKSKFFCVQKQTVLNYLLRRNAVNLPRPKWEVYEEFKHVFNYLEVNPKAVGIFKYRLENTSNMPRKICELK